MRGYGRGLIVMTSKRKIRKKVKEALNNTYLRKALGNFSAQYPAAREEAYRDIDFESLRKEIQRIKGLTIEDIANLSDKFERKIVERGGYVHRAGNGRDVARLMERIAARRNARRCVKSKSMASEEIYFNDRLKDVLEIVETDLGEWIIQQIEEKPSHMVMPAIHLTKERCADIFSRRVGYEVPADIPTMVKLARKILRQHFLEADIGISGCNMAAADTGTMVILTNEGNGRLTATLPPVHVVLLGYEKLLPRFRDIGPLVTAIPRSATAQTITSYVTMISAPSETFSSAENDQVVGKELHVILLDNGRLELLKDPVFRQLGQCIRCASCLNVCPVYEQVGGHVYGGIYAGGIGALLTAFFQSRRAAEPIQEMCLNCGRCREVCAGGIDIPDLILKLRLRLRRDIPPPFLQRLAFGQVLPRKQDFEWSFKAASWASRHLPSGLRQRLLNRCIPVLARKTFKETVPSLIRPSKPPKGRVTFFFGCLVNHVFPEIGEAVVSLIRRSGYEVILPEQTCCGAPALYTGLSHSALKLARENLVLLTREKADYLVTACPTGTAMIMKHWRQLLETDEISLKSLEELSARTFDFIRFFHRLVKERSFDPSFQPFPDRKKITYHYSCHLKRTSGIEKEPRELISAIPGAQWIDMAEADHCCGFAGTYNVKFPEISAELMRRKINNIEASGADIVAVDCPGCYLALRCGLERTGSGIMAYHSAVLLAEQLK